MYILTNEEMRAVDRRTIEQWEVPSQVLMESAGLAVVEALLRDEGPLEKQRVLVLAGPGNNGGDGLVIARHLYMRGAYVTVMVLDEEGKKSPDHEANRAILNHMPVRVFDLSRSQQLKILKAALNHTDLVIDALFGTGLSRTLSSFYIEAIESVNAQGGVRRVAVDSSSGLGGDRGEVFGAALKAHRTYALAYPKRGHFASGSERFTGDLKVIPIGIPAEAAALVKPQMQALSFQDLVKKLPERSQEGHKYSFGRLGVIAGSLGTSGACVLTSQAAMRTGCGAVQVLTDKSIFSPVATPMPEVMVRPVSWPNETASRWLMEVSDALVVGPGMGTDEEKGQVLQEILSSYKGPMVLDADALSLLAKLGTDLLKKAKGPLILTPHPGEMARLTGQSAAEIQNDRAEVAALFAKSHEVTLILKGRHSLVASSEGKLFMNTWDSPSLATAGSGDVLSGILGSLLAQGMEPLDAACSGVVLHGACGRICAEEKGVRGTLAGDLIHALPKVLLEVDAYEG